MVAIAVQLITNFCAPYIAEIYAEKRLTIILLSLSPVVLLNSLSGVPTALLRRTFRYKPLAARTLIANSVGGVLAITLAYAGYGVWSLVAQQLVASVVRLLLLWRVTEWRPGFSLSKDAIKDLLPFSVSMLGNNLVEFGNRQGDKLLIGMFFGAEALGLYALGYRFYNTLSMLLTGFVSQVSISTFSALQHNRSKAQRSFSKASFIAATFSFPIFALVAVTSPILIPQLVGTEWRLSVVVLQIFCMAGALECVLFFNGTLMISMGKPHWKLAIGLINVTLNTLGYLFFYSYGIVAFAVVYTIRAYLTAPLSLIFVKKLISIKIQMYCKPILISISVCVCMYFFVEFLIVKVNFTNNLSFNAVFAGVIGFIAYLCVVSIIYPVGAKKILNIVLNTFRN